MQDYVEGLCCDDPVVVLEDLDGPFTADRLAVVRARRPKARKLEQLTLARAGRVAEASGLTAHNLAVPVAAELPESDATRAIELQPESTQQWDVPAMLDDLEDLVRLMVHITRR